MINWKEERDSIIILICLIIMFAGIIFSIIPLVKIGAFITGMMLSIHYGYRIICQ